jgi:DNA-binding CsgD family transcriptional regulator
MSLAVSRRSAFPGDLAVPYLIVMIGAAVVRRHELTGPVALGREGTAELSIHDPSVSRQHCRFEQDGAGDWWVIDLGSTNRTLLRGLPVTRHKLSNHDVLRAGTITIRFQHEAYALEDTRTRYIDGDIRLTPEAITRFPELGQLTERQRDVFDQLMTHMQRKEMATELGIEKSTLDGHVKDVYRLLGVTSRQQLITKYSTVVGRDGLRPIIPPEDGK